MNQDNIDQKLAAAYDKMMQRVNAYVDEADQQSIPSLDYHLEKAKRHAIENNELTPEQAEQVADYVRRDLHDAAYYVERTGQELSSWFRFDLELIEERILELFAKAADKTRLELAQLASQANTTQTYRSGEITTIGILTCLNCGTEILFKKTDRIPSCPKCHETHFSRNNP